jgi:ketosteroid isomerase-like protein
MPLNDPAVIAEVTALFHDYERALLGNDVDALTRFFWDSPHAIRFGVNEHLYGADAIAQFRKNRVINFTDRQPLRLSVQAYGTDVATTMYEYTVKVMGQLKHGRQTQVWIRLPEAGWRIAAAHVSNALTTPPSPASWPAYVDQTAGALGLTIDPSHREGVVQNLQRAAAIAAPLLAFHLPDEAELAHVFTSS